MLWVFSSKSGKNPRDFISAGDITRGRLFQDQSVPVKGAMDDLLLFWEGRGGGRLELTDWLETYFSFSRILYQSLFFLSLAPSNEERS